MRDFSEEIEKSVDLLLKASKHLSGEKNLLDKDKIVYLQVTLFRIPFGPPRKRKYLNLRHSLYGDDPEICLFVPNRKTGVTYKKTTDELIDFCVDYYTDLLEKHKVKGIKTIMPLKQLQSEYGTFDLRRKLVRRFDLFLCKNSLLYNPRFLSSLGKIFKVANKDPLGIAFPQEDVDFDPEFQKNVKRAIFTSSFYISRFSDNYSIPIGCLTNSKSQLKENLQTVLQQLLTKEIIPGGLKNVRAMTLWPSQSKPVPFYISTELPGDLKTPRMKTNHRKRLRGVEGELSTQPNKKVFVMSSGEVFVTKTGRGSKKIEESDPEDEDSFVDDSEDEEMEEKKEQNVEGKSKEVKEESESEDDEEIEEKEARLLKGKMLNEEDFSSKHEETEEDEEEEEEEEDGKNFTRLNTKRDHQDKKNKSNKKAQLKKEKLKKGKQSNKNKGKR